MSTEMVEKYKLEEKQGLRERGVTRLIEN